MESSTNFNIESASQLLPEISLPKLQVKRDQCCKKEMRSETSKLSLRIIKEWIKAANLNG